MGWWGVVEDGPPGVNGPKRGVDVSYTPSASVAWPILRGGASMSTLQTVQEMNPTTA